MRAFRFIASLGLVGLFCANAVAGEQNIWPLRVTETAPGAKGGGHAISWQEGGPLFFGQVNADGSNAGGFRPIYVYRNDPSTQTSERDFLYPLLTRRQHGPDRRWSLLELVNLAGPAESKAAGTRGFDVWPVYFSRETGNPTTSYHALFPIAGTVINRLGYSRLSWVLFPLYGRLEQKGVTTVVAPWPFVRVISGNGNHGFSLWPLFGWSGKPGVYENQFYLWPLIYRNESKLSAAKQSVSLGVLPFYASDESAASISKTYFWPFFGFTHRWAPYKYDETRYFWPLLVQGRGDGRTINRWAPIYTHSTILGDDKRWFLWPLFRQERWSESGLNLTKTQLLYFLYWSLEERSIAHPALAPAEKVHLWPLFSFWDNGAGRRQLQFISPFEVFFPQNEPMRQDYSPLLALYRYDQRAPGDVGWSILWGAVTWRRTPARRAFHLGPLLGVTSGPHGRRISFGDGLFGLVRGSGARAWRPFLFDFSRKSRKKRAAAATP